MSTPRKASAKAQAATDVVSLEPILAALRKRVPKAQLAQAEAFVRAFYKRMSGDELPQHQPKQMVLGKHAKEPVGLVGDDRGR